MEILATSFVEILAIAALVVALAVVSLIVYNKFLRSRDHENSRGENDTPTGDATAWYKEERWLYVSLIIGSYILLLMSVMFLRPEEWEVWWGNQALFWTTQLGFFVFVGLWLVPGKLGWLAKPIAVALAIIILTGVSTEIWQEEESQKLAQDDQPTARKKQGLPTIAGFNLSFGLYSIQLGPGQSSKRMCMPNWSDTHFTRADVQSMTFTYLLTLPGSTRVVKIERPAGTRQIRLPDFKCVQIVTGTALELTIEVKPQTI